MIFAVPHDRFRSAVEYTAHQAAHRSRCLSGRGRCALVLGDEESALRDFEGSLVAVPGALEALWGYSETLSRMGRSAEAEAAMRKHDKLLAHQEERASRQQDSELEPEPELDPKEVVLSPQAICRCLTVMSSSF